MSDGDEEWKDEEENLLILEKDWKVIFNFMIGLDERNIV